MIQLRQLPGIEALEWALAQHGWTEDNSEWADDLAEELFGISEEDTYPWVDDDGATFIGGSPVEPSDQAELLRLCTAWEANFEPLRYFRDESDAYWGALGWDVTDGAGKQLEAMRSLGRPLLCAVKALHTDAKLNIGAEDAEAWAARLAEEARIFKRD